MPGTAISAALCALALAAGGTALAACGEREPTDEEAIRATLTAFADATRARQYARLCDEVLAPSVVREVEQQTGGPCADALRRGLGGVRDPRLTIGRIRVDGERASAEVRSSAAGEEPSRDIVQLVETERGWRISELAGASPPSPSAP